MFDQSYPLSIKLLFVCKVNMILAYLSFAFNLIYKFNKIYFIKKNI